MKARARCFLQAPGSGWDTNYSRLPGGQEKQIQDGLNSPPGLDIFCPRPATVNQQHGSFGAVERRAGSPDSLSLVGTLNFYLGRSSGEFLYHKKTCQSHYALIG